MATKSTIVLSHPRIAIGLASAIWLSLVVTCSANGLSRGGTMCRLGGFLQSDEPAIAYYQNQLVIGEVGALHYFDLSSKHLSDEKLPTKGSSITSAGATLSRVYLGTTSGLFVSRDLHFWKPIDAFKGKSISKVRVIGDDAWIGTAGELSRMHEEVVLKRYTIPDENVVLIAPAAGKILFAGIKKGSPPLDYCEPYLISEGLQTLDPQNGETRAIAAPGRAQEQAAVQLTWASGKEKVIFSDNFMSHKTYELDPASLSLATSAASVEPNYAMNWVEENAARPVPARDLMDALEQLFERENYLRYWRVWNDTLRWLRAAGEDARLKRMYVAAEPRNKEQMIKTLGHAEDAFAKQLLTMAIDRREYFREEVARVVESHKVAEYDALLLRILREAASIEPESIGMNIAIPFPCPSGQAADGLLHRMGEKAIPLIEEVAEAPTTRPIVQESLRHRLRTYSITYRKRAYKTPTQLRAENTTGADAVKMLGDKDSYVRFQAIQHLKATPNLAPLSTLVALLDDSNDIAAQAVMVITDSRDPTASDALMKVVGSPRVPVRVWAMIGLGKRGDMRAYDSMIDGLGSSNADVRAAAARGLGSLKDPRATDALRHTLSDTNWDVKNEAARALKAISTPQ